MEFVIRNRFTFNSKEQLLQTMKGTQALEIIVYKAN